MKSRYLKKILNDTKYIVSNHKNYIAVGSQLCHDLISVDKTTLKIKLALDTFNEGRRYLESSRNDQMLFIFDKLTELISSGEIKEIINENDILENGISVFYVEDGELFETFTDNFGWPNTTFDGYLMYENTHFLTKAEAINNAIKNYESSLEWMEENIKEKQLQLQKQVDLLEKNKTYIFKLKML